MVFERIVVGVDGSPEAFDVARQAARLLAEEGRLLLVEVVSPGEAAPAGEAITSSVEAIEAEARGEVEHVRAELGTGEVEVLEGALVPTLLKELRAADATLVALGKPHHGRLTGILAVDITTKMLHDAPCSVLVARPAAEPEHFPRSIVVGLDGTPASLAALEAAREVARRTGASLTALVADPDGHVDREAIDRVLDGVPLVEVRGSAVDALADADADLLVLGSRGLHGLKALGSVSERVAHRARCSVLVVR
jgi:nucleotide-binding universal stress UspA family protein